MPLRPAIEQLWTCSTRWLGHWCRYHRTKFREYDSWSELTAAADRREDPDLLGAIGLVRKYRQGLLQLVEAIKSAQVG